MKTTSQTIRFALWITLGIAIALTSLALNRPLPLAQDTTATPTLSANGTVTATPVQEDPGSTDGIMLMAVVIVLIVIVPILLRWRLWANRKRKKVVEK